ncbi:MAG: hypothetical protein IJQ75_03095 [Synergistaceae bacterium]|nr:hypothetical protein [Synergistaceae bacterium]
MRIPAFVCAMLACLLTVFQKVLTLGFFGGVNLWDTVEIISSMGVDRFMNELNNLGSNGEVGTMLEILLLILAASAVLGVVASVMILSGSDGGGLLEVSGVLCLIIFGIVNFSVNVGLHQFMNQFAVISPDSLSIVIPEIALWSALYFAGAGYSHASKYSSRLCKMRKESEERY